MYSVNIEKKKDEMHNAVSKCISTCNFVLDKRAVSEHAKRLETSTKSNPHNYIYYESKPCVRKYIQLDHNKGVEPPNYKHKKPWKIQLPGT